MSAKLTSVPPAKAPFQYGATAPTTIAKAPQRIFQSPLGRAPTPPARAPQPEVTHAQLLEAFNATLKKPEDPQLTGKFLKLFVEAKDPNFKDESGDCPIQAILVNHRLDLLKACVVNKKFDHSAIDESGETALFAVLRKSKNDKCPDPFAYVTELLKVVPVGKMNFEGDTVEVALQKLIISLERRKNLVQAQYLRESVLPAIQAKIAEENAAFEVEYRKRLAPIMRRIDQTEQVETTQARKVTSNAKTLASVDEKIHIRFQNLRASLPDQIRDVMKNECTLKMLTNPQKIAEVKPILEDLSRLVEQKIDRLSGDPLEGKNQQLSSSPTGTDNEGSLLKM